MPIERDRGLDTASLLAMDRAARGEDRTTVRTTRRSRDTKPTVTREARNERPIRDVVGPAGAAEASMSGRIRQVTGRVVNARGSRKVIGQAPARVHGVGDVPRWGTSRAVGQPNWRQSGAKAPRPVARPTEREAIDGLSRRPDGVHYGQMATDRDGTRHTRTGTTLWTP